VVGPYGPGTVFTPLLSNLNFIRLSIYAKTTKLGQLINHISEPKKTRRLWGGLGMFLDKQIRHDDSRMESVYLNYKKNLKDICEIAHKNDSEMLLSTVAINLKDNPPFASLHKEKMTEIEKKKWEGIYRLGIDAETKQHWATAIEYYLNAATIDECYAELQYRLAKCYERNTDYTNATQRYEKALEYDTLRFRADKRINEIIRNTGRDQATKSLELLDFSKIVKVHSDNNLADEEFFHEHVHLNFKGNYLLAKSFFKKIEPILPERIHRFKIEDSELLSEEESGLLLAYTTREQNSIAYKILVNFIKKPPFTNQLYNQQRIAREKKTLKELRIIRTPDIVQKDHVQYQLAIKKAPDDWWLRMKYANFLFFESHKDFEAAKQYEFILSNFLPNHDVSLVNLSMIYGKHGQYSLAKEIGLKTLRLYPTGAIAVASHVNLGIAYQQLGELAQAQHHFKDAIELDPYSHHAYLKLSKLLYKQNKMKASCTVCREGIKYIPDSESLHYGLAVSLQARGLKKEASNEFQETLRLKPKFIAATKALKTMSENDQ
jgi:tetratricopeptide (TPR) repeat protein